AITSPAIRAVVSGDVTITASSNAGAVQFFVDGGAWGTPVPVVVGAANATWATRNLPNGWYHLNVATCSSGCAAPNPAGDVTVQVANAVTSMITAPANGATVWGDVTVTAASAAPAVQFFVDGAAVGGYVDVTDGVARFVWRTTGASPGAHHLGT